MKFNVLRFVADNAGLDTFEALQKAYDRGKEDAQAEIIRCKDCKHYIPYEWMSYKLPRSNNINDYQHDEIGCEINNHYYPPDGFCNNGKRREE